MTEWALIATYILMSGCSTVGDSNPKSWENGCRQTPMSSTLGKYETFEECKGARDALTYHPISSSPDILSSYECQKR